MELGDDLLALFELCSVLLFFADDQILQLSLIITVLVDEMNVLGAVLGKLLLQLANFLFMQILYSMTLALPNAQLLGQIVDLDLIVLRASLQREVLLTRSS